MRAAITAAIAVAAGCGGSAPASARAPGSAAPTTTTPATGAPATPTKTADDVVAPPGEVDDPRKHDPAELAIVWITRIEVDDNGERETVDHEREDATIVARCYRKLPPGHPTNVRFTVTLERANPLYEGHHDDGGFAFGRAAQDQLADGIEDAGFTACVAAGIQPDGVPSNDPDRKTIRATRVKVLATPYGAVERYEGLLGHGHP